jgi:hypothetical protein
MATATPLSVRFEPRVLERLTAFVAAHREMSLSSASNRLVDEALRMHEHPLITFKDGPAGRRARLVGGPDVWEVIGAVRSVRESDPALTGDEVLEVVAETSGVPMPFLRAALAYWGDYPEEVDAFIDRARGPVTGPGGDKPDALLLDEMFSRSLTASRRGGSTAGPSSPTPCCVPCRTWRSSRPRCSRAGSS